MDTRVEELARCQNLDDSALLKLMGTDQYDAQLFAAADAVRRRVYGRDVYLRGLIEVSNICRNNCHYCGIRRGNRLVKRYRLNYEDILACCTTGYALNFRTVVLQGGEDLIHTDEWLCALIGEIKKRYLDCAITLSLGERPAASYQALFEAGADRYLLRHETADAGHYGRLHPEGMRLEERMRHLWELKAIGYQVGSGFMVGSPYQRPEHLLADLRFLQELQPAMIGIGPFISHRDTPFKHFANGALDLTLRLIAILRLLFPYALIPATTALSTIAPQGREMGLAAGANVVMPNLSPLAVRKLYTLYDNKICTGEEAAEGVRLLQRQIEAAGYRIAVHRGDAPLLPERQGEIYKITK
ncbi:MAG: [FeFe] hydrogenase H-cluster radical SAM maturase HydE [Desulfobulbus sp.]|nr:[FeFe] hydrogenase H-cluster radical SAM maturase HydE [Desulfobulbus sp.]